MGKNESFTISDIIESNICTINEDKDIQSDKSGVFDIKQYVVNAHTISDNYPLYITRSSTSNITILDHFEVVKT